jgi:hypothetical protein
MATIPELAGQVRAQLRQDELFATSALGLLGIVTPWHTPQQLMERGLTRGDALHVSRHSAQRVLGEVAAKRALLDEALSWEHGHAFNGEGCPVDPCLCGRDDRVEAVLTLLARPYSD